MAKKLAAILLCVVLIFVGVLALGHLTRPLGDDVAIANVENFHKLPEIPSTSSFTVPATPGAT